MQLLNMMKLIDESGVSGLLLCPLQVQGQHHMGFHYHRGNTLFLWLDFDMRHYGCKRLVNSKQMTRASNVHFENKLKVQNFKAGVSRTKHTAHFILTTTQAWQADF